MTRSKLIGALQDTIATLDTTSIAEDRKTLLQALSRYIKQKVDAGEAVALSFICTHNSRRSHLSQVWAQALAHYVGVPKVTCYSGGTETTALFPMAAKTLADSGFEITKLADGKNPIYQIKYAADMHPIIGFSKTYDHDFNPASNYAAIMTCASADEDCPLVTGSDGRYAMTFDDPKAFDNTPLQQEKYHERSMQIATELLYVMQQSV